MGGAINIMDKEMVNRATVEESESSLFLTAAYDVLNMIKDAFPDGKLPTRIRTRKTIAGSQVNEENEEFLYDRFYYDIEGWRDKYRNLKSVSQYLTYIFKNNLIDTPTFSGENSNNLNLEQIVKKYILHSDELIVFPVIDLIKSKRNTDIGDDELVESYWKYVKGRKSTSHEKVLNTPLIGFSSEILSFKFSNEFSVEPFSDRHKNAYAGLSEIGFPNGYTVMEIRDSTHMIKWKSELPKGELLRYDHRKHLYLLIMSMRLSISSGVVAKFSYYEPKDLISIVGGGGSWHFETSMPSGFYDLHDFQESDLIETKAIFIDLLRMESISGYKNIFNIVVNRYLSSLSRASPEDSVIDFTICLESLLLANERDELRFRLSLRGANLLQNEDPIEIKRILARMYDDRSAIVHNGKTLDELGKQDSNKLLKDYRTVTEKIIRAYIAKSNDFEGIKQINESLDLLCFFALKNEDQKP